MAMTSKRAVEAMENPVLGGKSCARFRDGGAPTQARALDAGRGAAHPRAMARAAHAFLLALRDLPHPRALRVLAQSLALTLLLLAAAGAAIFFAARWALARWNWLGETQRDMADILVILALIAGSWLLFRAVAIVVIGLFADTIVA